MEKHVGECFCDSVFEVYNAVHMGVSQLNGSRSVVNRTDY